MRDGVKRGLPDLLTFFPRTHRETFCPPGNCLRGNRVTLIES